MALSVFLCVGLVVKLILDRIVLSSGPCQAAGGTLAEVFNNHSQLPHYDACAGIVNLSS